MSTSTLRRRVRFEKKSERCHVALVRVPVPHRPGRKCLEATRAIREASGWRIDRRVAIAGTWAPWEPIDSEPRANLNEAKRAIRAYYAVQFRSEEV